MTQAKHTPGPWVEQPEPDGAFTIWAGERQLSEIQPDDMGDALPAEANARLIAAAPELLDALWQIVTDAEIDCDTVEIALGALSDIRATARAAIAKAKGA